MLVVREVTRDFGGVRAINRVSFQVEANETVGLIGPNGAGKTTLLNLISCVDTPTAGRLEFDGDRLEGRRPEWAFARGIARTFQNIRLFPYLSVLDNVLVAAEAKGSSWLAATLGTRAHRRKVEAVRESSYSLLQQLGLAHRADMLASSLPYPDRRRLEVARALAGQPKLLLLDEPTAGMGEDESGAMVALLRSIRAQGMAILVVSHGMSFVRSVCDRVVVLNFGETVTIGRPDEVLNHPSVIEAYLGRDED